MPDFVYYKFEHDANFGAMRIETDSTKVESEEEKHDANEFGEIVIHQKNKLIRIVGDYDTIGIRYLQVSPYLRKFEMTGLTPLDKAEGERLLKLNDAKHVLARKCADIDRWKKNLENADKEVEDLQNLISELSE